MRYLPLAAAAFAAMTTFASAQEAPVPSAPMQLSQAQLDSVKAGWYHYYSRNLNVTKQKVSITQNANATAINTAICGLAICGGGAAAQGGTNVAIVGQND